MTVADPSPMHRWLLRVAVLGVAVLFIGACSTDDSESILVSAASSLAPAFEEMVAAFEAERPDIVVNINVAGSTRLREQILEGASVDVFASASVLAMAEVTADRDTSGNPVVFALNTLVIGVPSGNPGNVWDLEDFSDSSLVLGACASAVPCGAYADEAFTLAGVVPELDTREPSVGALVLKLELGELDAGVVYRSDGARPGVEFDAVEIAPEHNVMAEYPIVALGSGEQRAAADDFVAFVLSDQGRAILSAYGFETP